jgi:hypothetical protein
MLGKQIGEGLIGSFCKSFPSSVSRCVTVALINSLAFASSFATLSAELLATPSLACLAPRAAWVGRRNVMAPTRSTSDVLARHSDRQIYQWRSANIWLNASR